MKRFVPLEIAKTIANYCGDAIENVEEIVCEELRKKTPIVEWVEWLNKRCFPVRNLVSSEKQAASLVQHRLRSVKALRLVSTDFYETCDIAYILATTSVDFGKSALSAMMRSGFFLSVRYLVGVVAKVEVDRLLRICDRNPFKYNLLTIIGYDAILQNKEFLLKNPLVVLAPLRMELLIENQRKETVLGLKLLIEKYKKETFSGLLPKKRHISSCFLMPAYPTSLYYGDSDSIVIPKYQQMAESDYRTLWGLHHKLTIASPEGDAKLHRSSRQGLLVQMATNAEVKNKPNKCIKFTNQKQNRNKLPKLTKNQYQRCSKFKTSHR